MHLGWWPLIERILSVKEASLWTTMLSVRGKAVALIWTKLHLWPQPVGHALRIAFPLFKPPNHCRACSRWPPCPHPGHQTNIPVTGSWQMKHIPTRTLQFLHTCRLELKVTSLSFVPSLKGMAVESMGLPHRGQDSWILGRDVQQTNNEKAKVLILSTYL